ncbi:protein suppressor of gene silencing 3 [Nicotiana attenuata]|uniref:Protein suppressor of gene silencing 3 n=1 Tax=Nicotiana attenuata TaxID=49451 RepID=A0A1J6J5W4_NICAT|nr:protein suppressor of gene silencing 3 [Nicotiana attenuata]
MHHEQIKEEMEYQEQFFKDPIKIIHDARTAEEDKFKKVQQEQVERVAKFIKFQDKEMKKFVEESKNLTRNHEDRMAALRHKY